LNKIAKQRIGKEKCGNVTSDEIKQYLSELNDELAALNVKGEICIYGGAVMCLAFNARPATRDVDAIFEPVKYIRRAAALIAERHKLRKDWLNTAVKMFLVEHKKRVLLTLSNITLFVPEPDYLLAMKVIAARLDTSDLDDIVFLVKHLGLGSAEDVVRIVSGYYPKKELKPVTITFVESLFES
jgi:hypothetical protein